MFILILILTPVTSVDVKTTDSDEDGLDDNWEYEYFGDLDFGSEDDPDGDGLTNLQEYQQGTNPTNKDTDADGMPDSWEVEYGFDPNDYHDSADDVDNDGYSNYEEFRYQTDPLDSSNSPKKPEENKASESGAGIALSSPFMMAVLVSIPTIVILLAIVFVYTKMRREQLLEHQVRADIYKYITQNPGVHYRGIMNDLNLHMGVLTHHLNMLEQERYIKSYQDGMYRRFYPKAAAVNTGLILTDVQEQILKQVRATPGITQADIARKLGFTTKVVYYHMKILSNAGFVHIEASGRESRCYYIEGLDYGTPPMQQKQELPYGQPPPPAQAPAPPQN
jgi:predicted transcriptional regulator